MEVVSIQVVLFFKDVLNRPDSLGQKINENLDNLFDAMPNIINLPPENLLEFPVVQQRCTKFNHALNIARSRCDLILNPQEENRAFTVVENRYSDTINRYVKAVIDNTEVRRVGIVITAFEEVSVNSSSALSGKSTSAKL